MKRVARTWLRVSLTLSVSRLPQKLRRCFSVSLTANDFKGDASIIGFESTFYLDSEQESSFLESSIRSGCKVLVGCRNSPHLYTLMSDLVAGDEIDASKFLIGHKTDLRPSKSTFANTEEQDVFKREITSIAEAERTLQFAKREKVLDFVSVPISRDFERTQKFVDDLRSCTSADIAYEFPTELLCSTTPEEIEDLWRKFSAIAQLERKKQTGATIYVLIATNVFTVRTAARIFQLVKSQGETVRTIAIETLRCHPRRPGLLNGGSRQASGANESYVDISSVIGTLEKAMDSCMKVEKQFLEKLHSEAEVSATDVCFANILAHAQDSFLFPEEWDYVRKSQVDPKLKESLDKMKSASSACFEWTMVYQPMAKYLFNALQLSLEAKKWDILYPIVLDIAKGKYNYSIFMEEIIRLYATLRPNFILLQGTKAPADHLNEAMRWIPMESDVDKDSKVEKLSSAGKVLLKSIESYKE